VIIKGLDPQSVPGQKKAFLTAIPQSEGKHPYKMLETINSPLKIGIEDHLRVGSAPEAVPVPFQDFTNLSKIINLTIMNDMHTSILTRHGLVSGSGQIDDGQPAMTQPHTGLWIKKKARIIRAAVGKL
jgi:hypothetical protein